MTESRIHGKLLKGKNRRLPDMIWAVCGILHKLIFGKMVAQRMGDRIIRRSTTEQVYTLIIEKIRRGEFAPGERLKIESLSREFGVSRTPIR